MPEWRGIKEFSDWKPHGAQSEDLFCFKYLHIFYMPLFVVQQDCYFAPMALAQAVFKKAFWVLG